MVTGLASHSVSGRAISPVPVEDRAATTTFVQAISLGAPLVLTCVAEPLRRWTFLADRSRRARVLQAILHGPAGGEEIPDLDYVALGVLDAEKTLRAVVLLLESFE